MPDQINGFKKMKIKVKSLYLLFKIAFFEKSSKDLTNLLGLSEVPLITVKPNFVKNDIMITHKKSTEPSIGILEFRM